MDGALVEQVRRFNRTVTQRVGALDDAFLARARPLGQARLLWEIGTGSPELRALRSRLDLDSGYLSRLLHALQADGLVTVETDGTDGRVRRARLTPAGLAELAELDRRSDDKAASLLQPLDGDQRDRLVAAMREVERLLVGPMIQIAVTDSRDPDAQYCIESYFAELIHRFDGGFDRGRTQPVTDLAPPTGLMLVATLHGDPVGCGGLRFHPDACTDVKRMWISPNVRGLGLGRRLLAALEAEAAARGARTVRLETNRALTEAVALYHATGYREVPPFNDEPYAHHWFTKTLA